MPSSNNSVVLACAGSGKTTYLVKEAIKRPHSRIAIITYTNNNRKGIIRKFGELNGGVPKHVDVGTWFSFLLRHGARPYQHDYCNERRIKSILFVERRSARGAAKTNTRRYYFASGDSIYSDKIAQFVIECEAASDHRVTRRLRQIYDDVFIDEFQDLAGWDLDLIEMFLKSDISVTLVGDPRQHIYSTNPSSKNKHYLGIKVCGLIEKWKKNGLCQAPRLNGSYRCNQAICTFANGLWAGSDNWVGDDKMEMTPLIDDPTEHDGTFLVSERAVNDYIQRFRPQVLRHDKRATSYGCGAINFGLAKGLQFDRVLIVPTGPIRKYLKSGDVSTIDKARPRLHVAVTRARHSVGFVYDGPSPVVPTRWRAARE